MFKRNNNRENESKILLTALNHLKKIIIIKNNNKNNHWYFKKRTRTLKGEEKKYTHREKNRGNERGYTRKREKGENRKKCRGEKNNSRYIFLLPIIEFYTYCMKKSTNCFDGTNMHHMNHEQNRNSSPPLKRPQPSCHYQTLHPHSSPCMFLHFLTHHCTSYSP